MSIFPTFKGIRLSKHPARREVEMPIVSHFQDPPWPLPVGRAVMSLLVV